MKDIPGYQNLYSIDKNGNVFSYKSNKLLKHNANSMGYSFVELWKDKQPKKLMIHRLLAITFIPNDKNYKIVDHIDGNKKNNSIQNLRWVTSRENACNSNKRNNTSSKYKGVSLCKETNKWVVTISLFDKKRKKIGLFTSEEKAALVYNKYAVKYYGRCAKLNVLSTKELSKTKVL